MSLDDLANLGQIIGALARRDLADLRGASNSAEHKCSPIRYGSDRARTLCQMVSSGCS
jgi:hypothetical protein